MATITFRDLQQLLLQKGHKDALESIEIVFTLPDYTTDIIDEPMKNKVITADCLFGNVVIEFDQFGLLKSVEIC